MHCLKSGFTLVELMVVVAIISILAAASMAVYAKYHDNALENEASANLFALSQEANRIINDWGISGGTNGIGSIAQTCLPANPSKAQFSGAETTMWDDSVTAWSSLDIRLDGSHHWQYVLCFYVKAPSNSEEFFAVAKRPNTNRYGFFDSSKAKPGFIEAVPTKPTGMTQSFSF